ncbi:hypothetical protein WAK64_12445 [Bacillus spongiae]|uniref:Uncharacterized protein n=1 Tax=Bacillus spongiae TaxID=2683610 RepID=A0ABU8HFF6_9BACI
MREQLNRFIHAYELRPHVQQLMPHSPFCLLLQTEEETWFLKWQEKKVEILSEYNHQPNITLIGSQENFTVLFSARQKLSTLVTLELLNYNGRYRDYLRMESILWLCG